MTEYIAIGAGVLAVAGAIAKITKNKKDDKIVGAITKVFNFLIKRK